MHFFAYRPDYIVYGAIGSSFGSNFNILIEVCVFSSFQCNISVRYILAVFSMAAWQGSIKWWVLRHRMHHRFTDTDLDPYDSRRGFWYAHFGWLMEKPQYHSRFSTIDLSDLYLDPVVSWNSKFYPTLVIFFGFFFPTGLGWLLTGSMLDGFLWIGVISRIISWNGIFLINSWAHWSGDKLYNLSISATGSFFAAFLGMGEGNHNFHHEFPKDFRHGYAWNTWDPTKWLLIVLERVGLAWSLYRTDAHLVEQSELNQHVKLASRALALAQINFNSHMANAPASLATPDPMSLPIISKGKLSELSQKPG